MGLFLLNFAHLEFLGLTVMAWKTLKRQVEPKIHLVHSVNVEKTLHPKSLRKCFNPKAAIVSNSSREREMTKELATVRCLKIKSVDLDLPPLK